MKQANQMDCQEEALERETHLCPNVCFSVFLF